MLIGKSLATLAKSAKVANIKLKEIKDLSLAACLALANVPSGVSAIKIRGLRAPWQKPWHLYTYGIPPERYAKVTGANHGEEK